MQQHRGAGPSPSIKAHSPPAMYFLSEHWYSHQWDTAYLGHGPMQRAYIDWSPAAHKQPTLIYNTFYDKKRCVQTYIHINSYYHILRWSKIIEH